MNFHHPGLRRLIRAALFLPIIGALSFCKRPEQDLGLNLQPEGDLLNVIQTDTLTLQVFTVVEDSLRTDELSQSVLGNVNDPETGLMQASFYTQLRLSAPDIDFGVNPVCDSIVLALKYTGQAWGRLIPQNIQVFELAEPMDQVENYYSNRDFSVVAENLVAPGTGLLPINLKSRLQVGADSVNPQLRIPLSLELGERLLSAGTEVYANNTAWLSYFQGLHVRSTSADGAAFSVDLVDVESRMQLFYHNDTDTLSYDYVINSLSARSNRFEHLHGNSVEGITADNPIDGSVRNLVQGGASLKTRIEIPFLNAFNDFDRLVINKAELIIPVDYSGDGRFPPIPQLFVLTESEGGEPVGLPGQLSSTIEIGGGYEPINRQYRFNITRWVQEYLKGNQAVNFIHVVSGNAGLSVARSVLNGPSAEPQTPSRNMRLVVTYSY